MGKTLMDLFRGSDKDTSRTSESSRIRSEFTGLRMTKWLPRIPLLYGNETIRITDQRTSLQTEMKESRGAQTDGGLVGQGIDRLTGGRASSLTELGNYAEDKLGLPKSLTPTRVVNTGKLEEDNTNERMITLAEIRGDAVGTTVGRFLAETGGGTPKQIIGQAVGQGIDRAKSAIRGVVFGTGTQMDKDGIEPLIQKGKIIPITTNKNRYSDLRPNILEELNKEDTTPFGQPLNLLPYKTVQKRNPDRMGERGIDYYNDDEFKNKTEVKKSKAGNRRRLLFTKAEGDDQNDHTLDSILVKVGNIRFNLATITGITENFNPNWDQSQMIGNPFGQYTYTSISRDASFNLKLYSMNPTEHKEIWSKLHRLGKLTYPLNFQETTGFITPPVTNLTIGSMYRNKFGFISSLSYTVDDNGGWELGFGDEVAAKDVGNETVPMTVREEKLMNRPREMSPGGIQVRSLAPNQPTMKNYAEGNWKLPKIIDVSLTFQFIESRTDIQGRSLYTFQPIT